MNAAAAGRRQDKKGILMLMLPSPVLFRTANAADIVPLREMQVRAMRELGSADYAADAIEAFLAAFSTMEDRVVAEGHYFLAETPAGRIVASGGWSQATPVYERGEGPAPVPPQEAIVRSVYVDPGMARCGLGTAVMRTLERDAALCGIRSLSLTASLSGARLYRTLGYEEAERGDLDLGAWRFACVKMHKRLAAAGRAVA